jgi:hypothetical protein
LQEKDQATGVEPSYVRKIQYNTAINLPSNPAGNPLEFTFQLGLIRKIYPNGIIRPILNSHRASPHFVLLSSRGPFHRRGEQSRKRGPALLPQDKLQM